MNILESLTKMFFAGGQDEDQDLAQARNKKAGCE